MPTSPWQSHQRLESTPDPAPSRLNPNAAIIHSPNDTPTTPAPKRPWWRRFLRSCFTSSNPDPDQENHKPLHTHHKKPSTDIASEPQSAEMEAYRKKQKRASYVPQHAASTFASSTTPLGDKDAIRAKRSTMIYQAGAIPTAGEGSEEVAGGSREPTSPPVGLSFDPQPVASKPPAAGHF